MSTQPTANILIVDDDLRTLSAMEALLSGPGRNVVAVSSGTEALRRLLRNDFALILLDVRLPEMDGFETAALIRQRERYRYTPIIFISAIDTLESDVFRGAASGAVDYLFKPVVPQVLQAKVAVFVDLFRMNEQLKRQAILQSEERFRLVVESLQDYAVFMMDTRGRVSSWNRGAERIGGWTQSEAIGQLFGGFYLVEDQERGLPLAALQQAAAVGSHEDEGWRIRKDGSRFWANCVVTALFDEQRTLMGFSAVIRDLTDRKRIEEELKSLNAELRERFDEKAAELFESVSEREALQRQLLQAQKMESLGTLAGGVAHDINNVLNVISAYAAQIAAGHMETKEIAANIDVIQETVQRGASLIRQLLAMSRKTEMQFERVQLNSVLEKIEGLLKQTFPKTIDIACDLAADVPQIMADANQVHQAVLNLCLNSRDAMPSGGKLLLETSIATEAELRQTLPDTHSDYVAVTVTDTGIGMEEATRDRIFEPFFTTKQQGEGTGLGLSVVYGIVTHHRGFLHVDSQLGQGTTVRMYLPVPEIAALAAAGSEERRRETPSGNLCGAGETILLAEDETRLVQLLQKVLETNGYRILVAEDGTKAVELYQRHKDEIALAILDIGLPKLNGWEAYLRMREINPSVKAMFATGYMPPDLAAQLTQLRHSTIFKPYRMDEVLEKVFAALKNARDKQTEEPPPLALPSD
jgi:two-component system cell cycle sensor histidine kinase/response regulator CckA